MQFSKQFELPKGCNAQVTHLRIERSNNKYPREMIRETTVIRYKSLHLFCTKTRLYKSRLISIHDHDKNVLVGLTGKPPSDLLDV